MANVGDIVFIGYNGIGTPEGFAFVVMNALPGNDIIKFTDNAINSAAANAFRTTEYAIQWNVPAAGVAAGTVVAIANWGSTSTISFNDGSGGSITSAATVGTLTLGIESQGTGGFNNNGDQIFAYKGILASPTILAGLDASSSPITTGTPDALTTYAPPPGVPFTNLPNGVNAKTIFTSNPGAQSIANLTNPANFSTNTTVFTFTDITPGSVVSTPTVTIAATDANAAEAGQDPGTFRITRTGATTNSLTVNYTVAGTATNGTDYTPNLTGATTIAAGQSFMDITVTPVDDATVEGNETVSLTLVDAADYDLGATSTATVAIANNNVEIAGITLTTSGTPVDSNGGNVALGDSIIFTFAIANIGNDPTQFRIPNQAITTDPGTVSGVLPNDKNGFTPFSGQLQYSTDNGATWTNIPATGIDTPSVPVNGIVLARVPVTVQNGAQNGDIITVTLGNTPGNSQNQLRSPDGGDVYTVDNLDGTNDEISGVPSNGVREASATGQITVNLGEPDLSAGISTPGPLTVGTPFNYTLDVQNNGGANANDIDLSFTLPANVTYNSSNIFGGGFSNPIINGSTITFTSGSIDAGNFAQINVNVTPTKAGTLGGTTLFADPNNNIIESNELNNSVTTGSFTVNAAPGLIIIESGGKSGGKTNITEDGVTDSYSVVLNSKPTADVTININSGNQTSTNINSLTFTPNNWDVAQTVTLTAIDDTVIEGNHIQTISHSATSNDTKYNSISILPVTANITDNDVAVTPTVNLSVSTNTGTEAEQTVITVNAIASSAVSGTQTVNLGVSGTNITLVNDYTLSNTIITIPDGQTTGSVTFAVGDDAVAEGSETATLSISNPSSGITLGNTTTQNISITDNDIPGVIISKANTNVTEGGATDNYTVVLATQPTAPVTVNITPSNNQINLGKGAGTAIFLDFTPNNWNILQTVTVTVLDDAEVEGNHNSSISHNAISKDSNYYLNLANIAVSIIDNDTEPTPNPKPIPAPNPELIPTPSPKPYSCGCEDLEKLINDSHNSKIPAHNPPHDFILASDDTDILFGGIGNDNIFGKSGNDLIFGNQDRDFINGNKGNDTIFGGKSNDFVRGGQNADLIFNDFGNDTACGDQGNDTVFGMIGDDILLGNTGDDFLNGNQGKDTVSGGEGNDVVRGGQDDDKLCGNTGSDTIFGDRGNDNICGCEGDDLIFGDEGNDTIGGGAGSDIFVLTSGTGSNTILDFMITQDKLALTKGLNFQNLTITQGTGNRANDSLIRIAATGELLTSLIGVSANAIAANMFTTV